jgi:predicted RNase H-like HicB family nuclease
MLRLEQKAAFSSKLAGIENMRYAVVIEKTKNNYSAYVPDLPGCIATGVSVDDIENNIRDAIVFHLEGMKEDGVEAPVPKSRVEYVEIAA